MINHGYTPDVLLKSTIVSIPKDHKVSLSNSDNYIGIYLFNCICKLFDYVILILYKLQLSPSEMQFGIKELYSTSIYMLEHVFGDKGTMRTIPSTYKNQQNLPTCFFLQIFLIQG